MSGASPATNPYPNAAPKTSTSRPDTPMVNASTAPTSLAQDHPQLAVGRPQLPSDPRRGAEPVDRLLLGALFGQPTLDPGRHGGAQVVLGLRQRPPASSAGAGQPVEQLVQVPLHGAHCACLCSQLRGSLRSLLVLHRACAFASVTGRWISSTARAKLRHSRRLAASAVRPTAVSS